MLRTMPFEEEAGKWEKCRELTILTTMKLRMKISKMVHRVSKMVSISGMVLFNVSRKGIDHMNKELVLGG